MNCLEQRLRVLERDFQRSRRANRLLVIAAVTVGCIASAQIATPQTSTPKVSGKIPSSGIDRPDGASSLGPARIRTIEAEQFVLLDQTGQSRLKMAIVDGGPAISLFDQNGQKRLEFGTTSSSTGIHLMDADESPMVSLHVPHDDSRAQLEFRSAQASSVTKATGFSVLDAAGQSRLQLALINGNFPMLGISQSGQQGPPSIEMVAGENSRSLKMHDEAGHLLFSVFTDDRDSTSMTMRHPDHDRSLQISTRTKEVDGPAIAFIAPAKEDGSGGQLPLLRIGLRNDHQPYIRIVDGDGRARFAAPSE